MLVRTESSVITKKSFSMFIFSILVFIMDIIIIMRIYMHACIMFVRIINYNSVCMTVLIYILSALTKKK